MEKKKQPIKQVKRNPIKRQVVKKETSIKINEINSFIQCALKNKSGVDQLKELMKMKYEHEAREASKKYHDAFCQMQAELPVIQKTKKVKDCSGKVVYSYAPLETIIKEVVPILKKYGFSYHWTESFEQKGWKKITCHITGHGHSETASIDLPIMQSSKMTNDIQQAGSTSTYGKRYSLIGILGIMADEETDAQIAIVEKSNNIKNVTPSKEVKKSIQNKYKLPDEILPDTLCNLGKYKDNPIKYEDIPLDNLLMLKYKSENPNAILPLISHIAEKYIINEMKEINYTVDDLEKYIKINFKKDSILDLSWEERLNCLRNLIQIKKKKEIA